MKQFLLDFYQRLGINKAMAEDLEAITFAMIIFVLALGIWLVTRRVFRLIFSNISKRTKSKFDDYLIQNKIPETLSYFPSLFILISFLPPSLQSFPIFEKLSDSLLNILGAIMTIFLVRRLLNSIKDFLKTLKNFKDKPIDSYIQVIMIFVWFIGLMVIFSILSGKDISTFLATLGALSAVILLIFKDTLLGFVASIQVTINDTVRIGDWISMQSYNADGDVIEINLSTVKVQNFDNTITSIPTYKLVSDSFVNWRGMSESAGRRIKRAILIRVSSISFVADEQLQKLEKIERIASHISQRKKEIEIENQAKGADKSLMLNGRNLTNIGLFRHYALAYLQDHTEINKDLTLMVRQLAPTSEGVPIEVYVFSKDKVWVNYERIMSDIFDHLLAAIPYFELECFEYNSNPDFSKKEKQ
ncbi:MAG: mechanosensitive ion channel family protein [Flavobacteriaceae bacterium]|jgi:miniconductance mechanosensitive channel|nr:mechanosensitive ion channel family protein [Flavobacteriaceae bacterium]